MIQVRAAVVALVCSLVAVTATAQEPPATPFGEGWRQVVPIPMPELLGEGDQYVIWVEKGWIQVRRETAKGVVDWQVVLARATGPKPPEVSTPKGTARFEVFAGDGRYFVREDANFLRCVRERKPLETKDWPQIKLAPDRYTSRGSVGTPEEPPKIASWQGEEGFVVTSSVGQTEDNYDCFVRLFPGQVESNWGYDIMVGPLRRVFCKDTWLWDDGDLLIALRTLEAGLQGEVKVGDTAPALEAKTLDGKPLKLADYRGKYVLLDFWATWCGPCVAEIPAIQDLYETFGKDGRLEIIGLSLDADLDAPRKFVAERKIPWNQVFVGEDSATTVVKDFGVGLIPMSYLIGPDGKVIDKGMRGEDIKAVVAKALSQH